MNRWQLGVMKMLGRVRPAVWQALWHLAETADEKGVTEAGEAQIIFRFACSREQAEVALRDAKNGNFYTLQEKVIPIKVSTAGGGRPIDRRRQVTKILNPIILKGEIPPQYQERACPMNDIRRVFKGCMRRKGYYYLIRYNRELQVWVRKTELYKVRYRKKKKRMKRKSPAGSGALSRQKT